MLTFSWSTVAKAIRDTLIVALGFLIAYWLANPPIWWEFTAGSALLWFYKWLKHDSNTAVGRRLP